MSDVTLKMILLGEDRSASKSMKATATTAEKTAATASRSIGRLGSLVGGEVGEMLNRVSEAVETVGEKHAGVGVKIAGVGAIATGTGILMQKMASGDIAAQNQLAAAVKATGKGYQGFGEDVDSLVDKQTKFGNTDGQVKDALRSLVQAYNDPKKALEQMNLVTDLAAAKHISLGDAAEIVAKAHGGAGRVFKEFGLTVGKTKDGTMDYDGALTQLAGKLDGQASASVDNFSGKVNAAKAKVDNIASAFAEKFGPAVTAAGPILIAAGAATELASKAQLGLRIKTIAATTATLVQSGVQKAIRAATIAWTAAQWLLNAALTANPIGIVIALIAALVVGIIYAYKHSETFRTIVQTAFRAIGAAASWLWNNALKPVITFILIGFSAVATMIGKVLIALSHIPGFGWAKAAGNMMLTAARAAKALADNINKIPPNKTVTVNTYFKTHGSPNPLSTSGSGAGAKGFASGTDSAPPGWAWVGEDGPELMKMRGGETILSARESARHIAGSSSGAGGGSTQVEHILVVKDMTGREILRTLLEEKRNRGGMKLGLE